MTDSGRTDFQSVRTVWKTVPQAARPLPADGQIVQFEDVRHPLGDGAGLRDEHQAHAVGGGLSTVDLSLFQVWAGLRYAFPRAFAGADKAYPGLAGLAAMVAAHPNVAAYLASERRIPFSESGIFRRYPELDPTPARAGRRKN